jgi:hypothetical protein
MNTKKVRIVEIRTCGDWYCTGHGVEREVLGEQLPDGKFVVNGKTYADAKDVFGAYPRDLVEVKYL